MRTSDIILLATLSALISLALGAVRPPPRGPFTAAKHYRGGKHLIDRTLTGDRLSQCEQRTRDAKLDHFSWTTKATFKQRYFVCDRHYKPGKGAIFFYLGNEADVLLYLNNTGLMWELAPEHNAMLVFAEHRYYGESKPFPAKKLRKHMAYLTSEQAMADYADLLWELKEGLGEENVPVIGFGGSYGGMLATWFRMKYPHLMDGAIAGSAPIWTYYGEDPPYDAGSFAAVVTRDASPEGGSSPECAPNARAAWKTLFDWGETKQGRQRIARAMRLCGGVKKLRTKEDVAALADWAQSSWDYLSMGSYPYPSPYILNGEGILPAFPVRVACEHLSQPGLEGEALLSAMAKAVGVFYNFSQALDCYDINAGAGEATKEDSDFWGYQYCTEQFQPFSRDGVHDMFWPQPFDVDAAAEECEKQWGVRPDPMKPTIEWGGRRIESASNIVFSNGLLDPWSPGGVLKSLSDTLIATVIPEGAHHLDLMFSNDDDPESVIKTRQLENEHIRRWIGEARSRKGATQRGAVVLKGKGSWEGSGLNALA